MFAADVPICSWCGGRHGSARLGDPGRSCKRRAVAWALELTPPKLPLSALDPPLDLWPAEEVAFEI